MKIYPAVVADTYTLRRLSANAVRFRLGAQLDWRLDLVLDSTGMHLLVLSGVYVLGEDRQVEWLLEPGPDYVAAGDIVMNQPTLTGELVVRSRANLKLPRTADPLRVPLDLRMRDYASLIKIPHQELGGAAKATGVTVTLGDLMPDDDTPLPDDASKRLWERSKQVYDRRAQ